MSISKYVLLVAVVAICGHTCCAASEDSVPALARALSQISSDRSVLEVPEGVYTIGSTWVIARSGVTIRGAGVGKTVFIRDPKFDGFLVKIDGENSTLSSVTVDGNGTRSVICLNAANATADAIEVKNFTHIGIVVPASDCRITRCVISGYGTSDAPSMGIWHDAGKTSTDSTIAIDRNIVKNNGMCGIYCTGGKVTIANNQITGNHIITNVGGGQIDIGNAFTTNTVAIIRDNTIADGGSLKAGGIEAGGGAFTITHNTIRNHGSGGIGIGHNVISATITGNTISNSGRNLDDRNRPQNRSGIYIGYGAKNLLISANRCFDDQPYKTQTWGVILAAPPARADPRFEARVAKHVTIEENDLRGNLHPEGLLDESRAQGRTVARNLPARANR